MRDDLPTHEVSQQAEPAQQAAPGRHEAVAEDRPDADAAATGAVAGDSAGGPVWAPLGEDCRRLRVAREAGGNLVVFGLRADRRLWQRRQLDSGDWDEWSWIADDVEQFDVATDRRGRLSIFSVDRNGSCRVVTQDAPYSAWGRPRRLGMTASQIIAVCRGDGALVVFALDDATVQVNEQPEPGGGFGEWRELVGDGYSRLAVTTNGFGQIVLFGITEARAVHAAIQRGPRGAWDDWKPVVEEAVDLAVESGPDGRLHLACVDAKDGVGYLRETRPGHAWGEREDLRSTCKQVVGFFRSHGPYELYGLAPDGAVWRTRRRKDGWDAWTCLGGVGYVQIDVFEDAKGALHLFALAASGRVDWRSRAL